MLLVRLKILLQLRLQRSFNNFAAKSFCWLSLLMKYFDTNMNIFNELNFQYYGYHFIKQHQIANIHS